MPLRSAEETIHQCGRCESVQATRNQLGKHYSDVHCAPTLRCSISGCIALFTVQGSLVTHERQTHNACPTANCTWVGPKRDLKDHAYIHVNDAGKYRSCGNSGCFMRHDIKTKPSKMIHEKCNSPGCLVSLLPMSMVIHKNIGPHLTRNAEVKKYGELVRSMRNGLGGLGGNGAGKDVREVFLTWKRAMYPSEVFQAYQSLHDFLSDHRSRCFDVAVDCGLESYPTPAKMLLIPTPESCMLDLDCLLLPPVSPYQSLNPFFELPPGSTSNNFQDVVSFLGTDSLRTPMSELDQIVENMRAITGLSKSTFRQVLQRKDDQCLVRYLTGFMLCTKETNQPRLFDVLDLYIETNAYYRIQGLNDGTVDQKPKAFSSLSENPKQQADKIRALMHALNLTPTELAFWHCAPTLARSATGGEPISRMGGFTILTTYGIRYSSQATTTVPWSSPYQEATKYNNIPKWYLIAESLPDLLGVVRKEAIFSEETEASWIIGITRDIMEDMSLGGLSELAMLAAADAQSGIEGPYNSLRLAVYIRAYSPLLDISRKGMVNHEIPPNTPQFSGNWERATRRAEESETGLSELRLVNSHTWWRPTDILVLDYVWLLFGSFDGLADIIRAVLPGKTYQSVELFLREYPNHFRRQPRTPEALSAHIIKYSLQESYQMLNNDPTISSRILQCTLDDNDSDIEMLE